MFISDYKAVVCLVLFSSSSLVFPIFSVSLILRQQLFWCWSVEFVGVCRYGSVRCSVVDSFFHRRHWMGHMY